jgi:hypothetical protein
MILELGQNPPPHFFLIGFRAPPGQLGTAAQQVGTLVARSVVRFDGTPGDQGEVLLTDVPYEETPDEGPFRFESEIAPWKPSADVIVVDGLTTFVPPLDLADLEHLPTNITARVFGTVAVDRGSGFGAPEQINFGWTSRLTGTRLGRAGRKDTPSDASSLSAFDAEQFDLPDQFDNRFHNGIVEVPGVGPFAPFAPGDQLRFVGADTWMATVPPAPALTVTENGAPLSPPLALAPLVDTVVMDHIAQTFTFVWRATFSWEPRFATATLTVG